MSVVANPNWFAVVSAVFVLCGICFLLKGALIPQKGRTDDAQQMLAMNRRKIDFGFGVPMVVIGAVFNVVGQLASMPFNWVATAMLLTLAYALLIYLVAHDLMLDRLTVAEAAPKQKTPRLALLPPVTAEPRELPLIVDTRSAEAVGQS